MASPFDRVRRALGEDGLDRASVTVACAAIALGTGLLIYGIVAP